MFILDFQKAYVWPGLEGKVSTDFGFAADNNFRIFSNDVCNKHCSFLTVWATGFFTIMFLLKNKTQIQSKKTKTSSAMELVQDNIFFRLYHYLSDM